MARRPRDRSGERIEALAKAGLGLLMLLALAMGGIQHFAEALVGIIWTIAPLLLAVAGVTLLGFIGYRLFLARGQRRPDYVDQVLRGANTQATPELGMMLPARMALWDVARVRSALDDIDWNQFEKFCAALLRADGFQVERKGGAQPDGGVDLLVQKGVGRALIQCKHWRTWVVQERVVREMLGSMAHFNVAQGAIYTLKGWTAPAAQFAEQHNITLVNGDELAASAASQLGQSELTDLLGGDLHHCPKCEAPMVHRSGAFGQFWGCSRFPACRGKLKHS